jgi:hypothetical protein
MRDLGGGSGSAAGRIAVDARGDAYVAGTTSTLNNLQDAFIAKVSGAGTVDWVRFVPTLAIDLGRAVAALPGGGAALVGSLGVATEGQRAFAARFDADGSTQWLTELDWSGQDWGVGVAFTSSAEMFVVGSHSPAGLPTVRTSFVAKIDASGNLQ